MNCAAVGSFDDDIMSLGVVDGQRGGVPLVVFDKSMKETVIISPANAFMATNFYYDEGDNAMKWGVQGKVGHWYGSSSSSSDSTSTSFRGS